MLMDRLVRTQEDILNWIHGDSLTAKHDDIVQRQAQGSGDWFLQSKSFNTWITNPETRLLLCTRKCIFLDLKANEKLMLIKAFFCNELH